MAKNKTAYFCSECGGESVKWMGQCPHCRAWNSLVEEKIVTSSTVKPGRVNISPTKALPLSKIDGNQHGRLQIGIDELDTVLGGGLVPGSSVLLGGEPGIGKSTLLLQAAHKMAVHGPVLYVSGEESPAQIKARADRLNAVDDEVFLLAQTDINDALSEAREIKPRLMILDSVQALFSQEIDSAPGSVSQVRAVAAAALAFARETRAAVIIIGHVTKEGQLAGPRVLEHMVDTVLYFEGERYNAFRLLRAVKNRFGSTNEIGVFEMGSQGLLPLASPSAYFLSEHKFQMAGSSISCCLQGTRPLLLEIQSLVSKSSFSNPRRLGSGFDYNRLLMIVAVLERKLRINLSDQDVYVNIVGGMRVDDPALDLAVAAAIISAAKDTPIQEKVLLLGEIGLLGELRQVSQEARRLKEGTSFGLTLAISPGSRGKTANAKIKCLNAPDLRGAMEILGLL